MFYFLLPYLLTFFGCIYIAYYVLKTFANCFALLHLILFLFISLFLLTRLMKHNILLQLIKVGLEGSVVFSKNLSQKIHKKDSPNKFGSKRCHVLIYSHQRFPLLEQVYLKKQTYSFPRLATVTTSCYPTVSNDCHCLVFNYLNSIIKSNN